MTSVSLGCLTTCIVDPSQVSILFFHVRIARSQQDNKDVPASHLALAALKHWRRLLLAFPEIRSLLRFSGFY
jgi:hypothetical protein